MRTSEDIAQFATVSANGDRQIGNIVSDGITKVQRISLQYGAGKH